MAPRTIKPSTAADRRDAVEQRVFDAVEALLDEGASYPELSVATIAEAAGMARSTFYVHFGDKTELLIRLATTATADIVAEGERWLAADVPETIADPDNITATMSRIIAVYRRHRSIFEAVLAAAGYDPLVAEFWRRHISVLFVAGTQNLELGQQLGVIDPIVHVEPLARMAAWSIERTISMHVAEHPDPGPATTLDVELAETMGRALWQMLFSISGPWPPGAG